MVPSGARRRRPTPRGRGEAFGPHDTPPRLVLSIAVFSARHRPRVRSNVSVLLASGSGFFTSEADTGNRLGSVGGRGRHNSSRGDPVDGAAFLAPRWGSRGPRPCVRLPACGHVPWDVTCSPPPSKPVNGSSFPFVFQECRVRCSSWQLSAGTCCRGRSVSYDRDWGWGKRLLLFSRGSVNYCGRVSPQKHLCAFDREPRGLARFRPRRLLPSESFLRTPGADPHAGVPGPRADFLPFPRWLNVLTFSATAPLADTVVSLLPSLYLM